MQNQIIHTLSKTKLNQILKSNVSYHPERQYLSKPFHINNHLLATDNSQLLYLSDRVVEEYDSSNSHLTLEEEIELSHMEKFYFSQSNFNPTTVLSLDDIAIKFLIKSIKVQQGELSTKISKTTFIYSANHNEMAIATWTHFDLSETIYAKPCGSSTDAQSFQIVMDTQFLLNSLDTHYELYSLSDNAPSIQFDASKPHYIKLVSDIATTIILQAKI